MTGDRLPDPDALEAVGEAISHLVDARLDLLRERASPAASSSLTAAQAAISRALARMEPTDDDREPPGPPAG